MKKVYKVLALLMAIAFMAAPAEAKIFRFGVKAGLNVSDMSLNNAMSDVFNPDNNCGWNAGVVADIQVPVIGICADVSVMYSRLNQGMEIKKKYMDQGAELPTDFGSDFIEIPVHLKYKFSLPVVGNVFAPYLLTGPSFAFNLNKKTFDDVRNRKCQTNWDFGIGFELFNHVQIQGAYCLGMNNLAKYWGENYAQDVKVKNNYWNVGVAYLF